MKEYFSLSSLFLGLTPSIICVFFGSLQNIFSRAAKYTVFDSTKEMAFIPLSPEDQIKGKSAIDGLGSRLGKSGSSLILQCLLCVFATPIACSPIIFIVIAAIIPIWMIAIRSLNRRFTHLQNPSQITEPQREEDLQLLKDN